MIYRMKIPATVNHRVAALVLVSVFLVSAPPASAVGGSLDTTVSESNDLESFSGASFAVPDSLQDDVNDYRNNTIGSLAPNTFVLADHDTLSIVFTDKEPTKGQATVSGISSGTISSDGLTFSVITAQSVSFETEGEVTTIPDVVQNQSDYQQDLVRIQATHRRISVLNDPDQGANITAPTSSGVLIDSPTTTNEIFARPGEKTRSLVINTSTTELGSNAEQETNQLLGTDQNRLYTFDFEERFWMDSEQTVDGIVLTPGSKAREFASTFDATGTTKTDTNGPLLYVVNSSFQPDQYDTVQGIKSNARDGDIVEVSVNLSGQKISTQETLEASTGCGDSQVQVQTPSGPVCIEVVQDTLLHAGVAWSSLPTNTDDLLLAAGLSSKHLDQPSATLRGQYRVTGEVVSTTRFDDSLPDEKILVIYDSERVGDTRFGSYSDEIQTIIKNRSEVIQDTINSQIGSRNPDVSGPPEVFSGTENNGDMSIVFNTAVRNATTDNPIENTGSHFTLFVREAGTSEFNRIPVEAADVTTQNGARYTINRSAHGLGDISPAGEVIVHVETTRPEALASGNDTLDMLPTNITADLSSEQLTESSAANSPQSAKRVYQGSPIVFVADLSGENTPLLIENVETGAILYDGATGLNTPEQIVSTSFLEPGTTYKVTFGDGDTTTEKFFNITSLRLSATLDEDGGDLVSPVTINISGDAIRGNSELAVEVRGPSVRHEQAQLSNRAEFEVSYDYGNELKPGDYTVLVTDTATGVEVTAGTFSVTEGSNEHRSGVSQQVFTAVAGSDGLSRTDIINMVQNYLTRGSIDGIDISRSDVLTLVQYYLLQ